MTDTITLEPCPFCGTQPSLFASGDHSTAWEGGCGNEKCKVQPHFWELTKEEAVAAWNRRAPSIAGKPSYAGMPAEEDEMRAAAYALGKWLSAALDDPTVCAEMKRDINAWFNTGMPSLSGKPHSEHSTGDARQPQAPGAVERDAMRYRWLRGCRPSYPQIVNDKASELAYKAWSKQYPHGGPGYGFAYVDSFIDAAIDAAMQDDPAPTKSGVGAVTPDAPGTPSVPTRTESEHRQSSESDELEAAMANVRQFSNELSDYPDAFEAFNELEKVAERVRAALGEARDKALEVAAKVCDTEAEELERMHGEGEPRAMSQRGAARSIRSLKSGAEDEKR